MRCKSICAPSADYFGRSIGLLSAKNRTNQKHSEELFQHTGYSTRENQSEQGFDSRESGVLHVCLLKVHVVAILQQVLSIEKRLGARHPQTKLRAAWNCIATCLLPVGCCREPPRLSPHLRDCWACLDLREQHRPQRCNMFQRPSTEIRS